MLQSMGSQRVRYGLATEQQQTTTIISNAEHLFMGLLSICMAPLEKCLFRSVSHFWTALFGFLMLSCKGCLCILEINLLSVVSFANIFSHSEGCLFILCMFSFAVQKILSLVRSHLFIFVLIFIILGGESKMILLQFF